MEQFFLDSLEYVKNEIVRNRYIFHVLNRSFMELVFVDKERWLILKVVDLTERLH